MDQLTLGVLAHSRKKHERRLPIHPEHLDRIEPDLLARIGFESGYGERFGRTDDDLAADGLVLHTRAELIDTCDVILLPKPLPDDLRELRDGQILWGWPHCVQDETITQLAIDKRLTMLAFEAMNYWNDDGSYNLHVFHKNNELAGYASVLHALQTTGSTGAYGRPLRATVIGFGATGRGAVTGLAAQGIHDVNVLTARDIAAVGSPIHSANLAQLIPNAGGAGGVVMLDGDEVPLAGFLAEHDIIVNCVLQDPASPMMFLTDADLPDLAPGTLVVDVSCDEGMGFTWAKPTTFDDPTFVVGRNVIYYGVDHSPSYLWNSATWEVSAALLPYLEPVLAGRSAWDDNETLRRAVEISDGVIENPQILAFQHRSAQYPHEPV